MDDEPEFKDRPKSSRAGCAILLLIGLLFLYVLSPPFVEIVLDFLPASAQTSMYPILEVIYAPLGWLYENFEIVEGFYDWYLELFDFL